MKSPTLQNKRVAVLRMAFRARRVFGTSEKRSPVYVFWVESGKKYEMHKYLCHFIPNFLQIFHLQALPMQPRFQGLSSSSPQRTERRETLWTRLLPMLMSFKVNEVQLLLYCCVKNDWQMSMNNGENSLLVPGMVMKTRLRMRRARTKLRSFTVETLSTSIKSRNH